MAATLPYLPSNKNLAALFGKIASAKVPVKFSHKYLQQTIGLKGTNDRSLIPLLRNLGLLDTSNTPTPAYSQIKNPATAKATLASAIKKAYQPLFDANEAAHALTPSDLKGLIGQVAGTDEDMTARTAATFAALVKLADFSVETKQNGEEPAPDSEEEEVVQPPDSAGQTKPLRTEFHYNIQIHLPANGTEATYLNIFNAMRKVFA